MDSKLLHHILKAVNEFRESMVEDIASKLLEQLTSGQLSETREELLLTDIQLCKNLQISLSHLYKLKKKYRSFPVYDIDGAKRYKQSEVEHFFKSLKQ